jgi:ATP-dependent DNA ligase
LASAKHDGLRMFLFLRDGEVHTASRGGQDYDVASTYIREDPFVIKLLTENPDLILDGELYVHGEDWNLQRISGLGRKTELEEDHKYLTFHCYDIVDTTTPFKLRAKKLGEIQKICPKDSKLVIVDHTPVTGLDQIMALHDKYVADGYEGLVIRDPEKEYKCGARDNRMLKVKEMTEDSFLITGYELGLRGVEDMCFTLQTNDGKAFKAKPQGDRALKESYMEEMEDIIGRKGDVKFFNYTPDGIPNLPVFLTVRYDI